MNTHRTSISTALRNIATMAILLIPLAGCYEDTVSPCFDCTPGGRFSEVIERSFAVDEAATVTVENFVGKVTYRTGKAGSIAVRATKRADSRSDLEYIEVEMTNHRDGLDIRTSNPDDLHRASVDLEITAPPGTRPRIATGVGDIDYQGRPWGACRFTSGVGSVRLRLRADVSIAVDLTTGVGSIYLDFRVEGSVRRSCVVGRIGDGSEGSVHATTGVGTIHVIRR